MFFSDIVTCIGLLSVAALFTALVIIAWDNR